MPLALTEKNARKICELAGKADTKVFAGAIRPMVRPLVTAEEVHGKTGLDGATYFFGHGYENVRTLRGGRAAPWLFVAASVALFHTHYVYWATLLAAVLVGFANFMGHGAAMTGAEKGDVVAHSKGCTAVRALVSGFGRIVDMKPEEILTDLSGAEALIEAEPEVIAHMNADHAETTRLYATKLLGAPDGDWRVVGCDQSER